MSPETASFCIKSPTFVATLVLYRKNFSEAGANNFDHQTYLSRFSARIAIPQHAIRLPAISYRICRHCHSHYYPFVLFPAVQKSLFHQRPVFTGSKRSHQQPAEIAQSPRAAHAVPGDHIYGAGFCPALYSPFGRSAAR